MSALVLCLENLCLLIGWSEPGMLFAGNDTAALELMMKIEPSKLCPFYGRCLAFQVNILSIKNMNFYFASLHRWTLGELRGAQPLKYYNRSVFSDGCSAEPKGLIFLI
jgi:hypothetical protein